MADMIIIKLAIIVQINGKLRRIFIWKAISSGIVTCCSNQSTGKKILGAFLKALKEKSMLNIN